MSLVREDGWLKKSIWDKVDFTFPENVKFYYGDEKGHAVKGTSNH